MRWLPNEILVEVIKYLMPVDSDFYEDLLALCRTSRLLHGLATPMLYRNLRLYTLSDIHTCFSSLRTHATLHRGQFVRRLVMGDLDSGEDIELSADLIEELAPVWHSLCHLQHLELSVVGPLSSLLHESHFPELTEFKSTVTASFSEAFRSFINRHPTLVNLDLVRGDTDTVIPNFGTISLPRLKKYSGPDCFISNLVVANKTLEMLVISVLQEHHEGPADGPRIAHTFAALGDCIAPLASPLSRQPLVVLSTISDFIFEHDLLRYAASGIPHIGGLKIVSVSNRFSEESARTIASTLPQFSGLYELSFINFWSELYDIQAVQANRPIIESWGKACQTLALIELYGGLWKRVGSDWVFDSLIPRNEEEI
ncbi:hypothetical protein DFH06DRAFT_1131534 [Mycena polygramma]|nr:hypothetical protein DFH06DRAFT_1131534 [Mycena polygramma]